MCSHLHETPDGRCRWMWIEEWREGKTGAVPSIYGLYVNPPSRRRGVARALLLRVMTEIRSEDWDGEILIQAKPSEGSISKSDLTVFYQSLGLTVVENWE